MVVQLSYAFLQKPRIMSSKKSTLLEYYISVYQQIRIYPLTIRPEKCDICRSGTAQVGPPPPSQISTPPSQHYYTTKDDVNAQITNRKRQRVATGVARRPSPFKEGSIYLGRKAQTHTCRDQQLFAQERSHGGLLLRGIWGHGALSGPV